MTATKTASPQDLAKFYESGDQEAFTKFERAYRATALGLAEQILDRNQAEDAVQIVFMNIASQQIKYDGKTDPRAFLMTAIREECLSLSSSSVNLPENIGVFLSQHDTVFGATFASSEFDPAQVAEKHENSDQFEGSLALSMTPELINAFRQRVEQDDLTDEQIAELAGVSSDTVSAAKDRLKDAIASTD